MKKVSYQDLKKSLSSVLDEVASGAEILITRHNRPTAVLRPPEPSVVRVGARFGNAGLKPLLLNATEGRYLEVLRQDRQDETDRSQGGAQSPETHLNDR